MPLSVPLNTAVVRSMSSFSLHSSTFLQHPLLPTVKGLNGIRFFKSSTKGFPYS
ncbi:hypothetical protein BD408DRAFT_410082 [Parasitella parasitica]|nr:hypothetical protein BD408DRAFT_410082 [Parasitella parasitica]